MKYKIDDRFKTNDNIESFEDFESMTLNNLALKNKQEEKKEVKSKYGDKPPKGINAKNNQTGEQVYNTQSSEQVHNNQSSEQVHNNQSSEQVHNSQQNQQNYNPQSNQQNYNPQSSGQGYNNQPNQQNYNPQSSGQGYNNQQRQNSEQQKIKQNNFTSNKPTIIELKNVGLAYDREIILQDVNLKIGKGDFVYLVGESGAGKSSIIKMLYREINASKGEIIIDGQDITRLRLSKMPKLRRKIGVIFQDYKLLPDKTIFKNVAFSLEVTGYPRRKIKARVMEVLQKVGISNQAYKYPNELSGGQQQRAAIARAIVDEPIILVADEPTGNLDPENALAIMEILEQINEEGTTVVMATHDVGIVNNFPKRVILLGQRRVLKESQGEYIYE